MSKQTIGLGTAPNDDTGDPARTAFDKINDNFDELYVADVALAANTTDVTTGDASTSKHGLLKKLSNSALDYMNGVGGWSVPAGGGSIAPLVIEDANTVAQRNGATGQVLHVYDVYNSGADYRRLTLSYGGGAGVILSLNGAGANDSGALYLRANPAAGTLELGTAGTDRWRVTAAGHLLGIADNTYDIGATGATRPRSIFVGTRLTTAALTVGTATVALSPTKGNVLVGDGTNFINLGVGTNTHVLTADSAEASGVKWAAGGGGGSITVADTQVLFADGANTPAGDAGMTYNKTTNKLTVGLMDLDDHLRWTSDGGGNIGDTSNNRPANIYASNVIQSAGSMQPGLHLWLTSNGGGVTWGGSADVWLIRNAAGQLQTSLDATNATFASLRTIGESNTRTASYTLVLSDVDKTIEMNVGSANDLTVPPNADVAFPLETIICIDQIGAGQTTVVAGAGVTINSKSGNLKLAGQWSSASLRKRGTNTWLLTGDLVA